MTSHQLRLLVGIPVGLLCLALIGLTTLPVFRPMFTLIVIVVALFSSKEFFSMARLKGYFPITSIGLIFVALLVLFQYFEIEYGGVFSNLLPGLLVLFTFITLLFSLYYRKSALASCAVTLFPLLYLALPLSYLIYVRFSLGTTEGEGIWWLVYLLLVTKGNDIGALYVGKSMGKHLLAKSVSPAKTMEGALGGLLGSILLSYLMYGIGVVCGLSLEGVTWLTLLIYAIVLGLVAQIGDLIESLLKRDAGVKDSSHLPGLGGILDILDSIIFTAPLLYYLQRG
jgi:phosphatidate cytidylyltransferase